MRAAGHRFIRVAALVVTMTVARGVWADDALQPVGVATVDITPEHPIRLLGYAARQTESEGVEQRLHAKALAIGSDADGPALLITFEICVLPDAFAREVAERIEKRHGIARQRLALCVTHTHTGPALPGALAVMFGGPLPPDHTAHIDRYARFLVDALERVAGAALADRRPARLSWSAGKAGFAANRRAMRDGKYVGFGVNPAGPVDHAMPMLQVRDPDGRLRAVVANYACHCTTLGSDFNRICGDWAGYAQDEVEARHPGATCLITIGCGADANPEPRLKLDQAKQHGRAIADEVSRLLSAESRPLQGRPQCRLERFGLPLGTPPTRAELEARAKSQAAERYQGTMQLARLDSGEGLATEVPYTLQSWTFGEDLAMVFMAGEVVVDYVLRFKREFDADRLWVTAYANDVPCYIPSRRVIAEGGYEVDQSMRLYNWPTRFAPEIEDLIAAKVHGLLPATFRAPATRPAP